jgi:hypothetical protein
LLHSLVMRHLCKRKGDVQDRPASVRAVWTSPTQRR